MKLWTLPVLLVFLVICLTTQASSCGILNPEEDPDAILPLLRLDSEVLVAGVVQASTPDSFGNGDPATMRFDLTAEAVAALEDGAIMELVLRVPDGGTFGLAGWTADDTTLVTLETGTGTASTGGTDHWWRSAWADPDLGYRLVTNDGSVRIQVTPIPDPAQVVLRVIEIPNRLRITLSTGRTVAVSGNSLLLQSNTEGRLISRDVEGNEVGRIGSAGAPGSLCYLDSWHFGASATELRFMSSVGGTWARAATLPWGDAYSYALTTDGTDLYMLRRPLEQNSGMYHILYRLSADELLNSKSFSAALIDSTLLERNGLLGGEAPGFAYWHDERQLVVPGRQDGLFGLFTFTRTGRFRKFIPLPFSEGGIGFAFVRDYLFVTSGDPLLSALAWTGSFTPASPSDLLLYRWPTP